jgi:predicted metal-dependent peptidase
MLLNQQITHVQRVHKAVSDIMHNDKYIALAGILMVGERGVLIVPPEPERDPLNPYTACTNGMDEYYYDQFLDILNDPELRFLILHENYHKLYKHPTLWAWMYELDAECANAAWDFVINIKISDDNKDGFATMPMCDELDKVTGQPTGNRVRMGCYDEQFRGWDSAKVFHHLREQKQQGGGGGEGQGQGNGGGQLDEHDMKGAKAMNAKDKQALAQEIDEAIRQGALMAGKVGSGDSAIDLEELLEPQINWRDVLREFVTTTCSGKDYSTWKKPNRRFIGAGVYLPSGVSEQVEELVWAIDMSGSVMQQVSKFLSEGKGIIETIRPRKIRILYWDTEVCGDEEYELDQLDSFAQSTSPVGGGGTVVECVPEYMQANGINPQAVIVFTDGYLGGGWGQWNCPVLWCVLDNKSAQPDNGKCVHIAGHEM